MRLLSLNCQKGYNPNLINFLKRNLENNQYDFLLLQEVTEEIIEHLDRFKSYKILTVQHEEIKKKSQLCIVYRNTYILEDSTLVSLENYHPDMLSRPEYGLLLGIFLAHGEKIQVGSFHLHPKFSAKVRQNELKYFKQILIHRNNLLTILGGDGNFGPMEIRPIIQQMGSEFICMTKNLGPTLNSRYTEYHPNIINMAAVAFAKIGLGISLSADHFFVDKKTASTYRISCRKLLDRISDHSPIEFTIDSKISTI